MKSLPELDLELQDEDTPEIITGNKDAATLDDDDEGMSLFTKVPLCIFMIISL